MHAHIHSNTHANTHTYKHTHTHTRTHTHTHARTHTYTLILTHTFFVTKEDRRTNVVINGKVNTGMQVTDFIDRVAARCKPLNIKIHCQLCEGATTFASTTTMGEIISSLGLSGSAELREYTDPPLSPSIMTQDPDQDNHRSEAGGWDAYVNEITKGGGPYVSREGNAGGLPGERYLLTIPVP
jgi:hypothetical protein